ncbi:MAG: class I SAM-dependent methyltransferase [Planctomycetales bacterium]|nr:class I SAM-dependent methyltransferase [Planctomycetales bacterium]
MIDLRKASETTGEYRFRKIDPREVEIKAWHWVDDLNGEIAQLETVFWEPEDTLSLRQHLIDSKSVKGAAVLEIGTGTGLVSLVCAEQQATRIVATDINALAVLNARYNAELLGLSKLIEVRQVSNQSPGPFAVLEPGESFDLIISNPPWENEKIAEVAAHALYDPDFALLDRLILEAKGRLNPGGKMLLAYGAKKAITRILENGPQHGWNIAIEDQRQLETLPEVFLPGMLLILTPQDGL